MSREVSIERNSDQPGVRCGMPRSWIVYRSYTGSAAYAIAFGVYNTSGHGQFTAELAKDSSSPSHTPADVPNRHEQCLANRNPAASLTSRPGPRTKTHSCSIIRLPTPSTHEALDRASAPAPCQRRGGGADALQHEAGCLGSESLDEACTALKTRTRASRGLLHHLLE